jgi:hypothetical protein
MRGPPVSSPPRGSSTATWASTRSRLRDADVGLPGDPGARDHPFRGKGASLTPFINEHEEIAVLLDRWSRARSHNGQVIALVGQGGMGKSRILAEAIRRIRLQKPSVPIR